MYAPTSMPFVSRTRAIFRSAEFGFLGVMVETRVQTPRFCGAPWRAGVFVFAFFEARPFLISWLTVGMKLPWAGWIAFRRKRSYTHERPARRDRPTGNGMVAKRSRERKRSGASPADPQTDIRLLAQAMFCRPLHQKDMGLSVRNGHVRGLSPDMAEKDDQPTSPRRLQAGRPWPPAASWPAVIPSSAAATGRSADLA